MSRLAIFGATGTVGSELLSQAIDAGHEVRVDAWRSPRVVIGRPTGSPQTGHAQARTMERGHVARFMLSCFTDQAYVPEAPLIWS